MKLWLSQWTPLLAAGLLIIGCGKSAKVDPAPVDRAFASADAKLKSGADKAVAAIRNADYQGALAELQKLAANAKLTDAQKKAVSDVVAQLQQAITELTKKAADGANKAVGDLQKSIGK